MLWWVSLLVYCVVAVRLAAAMGEVTCETLKTGVPIAIPSFNGSLTPPTVVLEKCRWGNVGVQLVADGPFVVVLRDVHLVGGSLTVVVSGGMEGATVGSSLILQNSTLIDCSKCLCLSSASAPLFHVDLVVADSIIQGTESAATLDAPYIRDSSIRVTDSIVEVHSQANAVAASANTARADSVRIEAINSNVAATTTNGMACSMGFASYSKSGSSTITANNATLFSANSIVIARGTTCVASMGFASYSSISSSKITVSNATLYSAYSNVTASGSDSVASMAFTSSSGTSTSTITVNNATLFSASSNATASGSSSVACMGFTSSNSFNAGSSIIVAYNATLYSSNSSVTATGGNSVASIGFASFGATTSTTTANDVTLYCEESSVTATGSHSVASMGFASRSIFTGGTSTTNNNRATFYAASSSVTATGFNSVASMGFSSYSAATSGRATITANSATVYSAASSVTATGSYPVASMGFASYSGGSGIYSVTTNNVVLVLCASRVYGSGAGSIAIVGSDPTPALPFTARCLLVRSQIVMDCRPCVTMLDGHTEGALPSLAMDLSLQCGSVGTLPRCSHNVTSASQTPVPSPAGSCPTYNFTTCDTIFPTPVHPSIVLPPWMRGGDLAPSRVAHSFSQTVTAPSLSRTATSAASHSTFSRRQGAVSMLASNNTCTMTTRSALSPSVTPSMAVLGGPSPSSGTVHVAAQLIGSEAAARAVVSSTSVSAAMSSVVSAPSAMASASRVASLSKVVDCGFGAEIDGENAVPDMLDLPVHPAVGSSRLRYYVGGVALTSSLLVLLPLLAVLGSHAKLGDTRRSRPTLMWLQRHIFTTFAFVCVGFFGPPVVGGGVLLLFFSDAGDWGAAAVGALGVASVVVAWGFLAAGLWRLPLSIDSSNRTSVAGARLVWNFKRRMCVALWCFAGSSRDLRGVARFYFSEELLASCAMAAIANAPRVDGSCHGLAWAMAAVAVAHLAFVAVVRPYDLRLDNVWSLLVASLQVALSVVQTAVVYGADGRDVAAALVLALCASFFLQAALGAMLECVALSRRRVQRVIQGGAIGGALEDNSDKEDGDSVLTVPLTNAMNPLVDAVPPHAFTENN